MNSPTRQRLPQAQSLTRKEQDKVREKLRDVGCVIDHRGFESVCLNEEVLLTAYYGYKEQFGVDDGNEYMEALHVLQTIHPLVLSTSRKKGACASAIMCSQQNQENIPFCRLYRLYRGQLKVFK
ncbi:hypothetical protein F7725_001634 [Dissostichus mawsoni]|uniref:Uncharacterized protein n=1 Tax=Dissostichus mawsoni TaxID=36200 RepID=A0A7J5Y062_DISMA|nr:hypothetical protein F7725_001634 [Dissostichus mawsoni]